MRIKTHCCTEIIVPDEFKWEAWNDETLDYDSQIGVGATEAAAIEDLCWRLDLDPAMFLADLESR